MKIDKALLVTSCISLLLYSNCQVKENLLDSAKNASLVTSSDHINLELNDSASPANGRHLIAKMRKSSCPSAPLTEISTLLLEIPFKTAWEESSPVFQVDIAQKRVYVLLGETKLFMPLNDVEPALAFARDACGPRTGDPDQEILQNPVSGTFAKSLLENLVVDCQFTLAADAGGWFCRKEEMSAALVAEKLDDMQRRVVHKWQRQPYLLVRKIAMGMELASILRSQKVEEGIANFCAVAGYALPQELPLVLQQKALRGKLCDAKGEVLAVRALFLLNEMYREIEALSNKFESQSPLGTLVVRLSKEQASAHELWVTLKPAVVAGAPSGVKLAPFDGRPGVDLCWHGLYDSDQALLAGAIALGFLHQGEGHCIRLLAEDFKKELVQAGSQVACSTSSEMEFSLTNGRGIMLRLPEGDYTYSVQPHPQNISGWGVEDAAKELAHGVVSWEGKHPVVTIR